MSRTPEYYNSPINIGVRISALRKQRGLSQKELASQLSDFTHRDKAYSFTTISSYETGRKRPPLDLLQDMAEFFGVELNELVGEDIQDDKPVGRSGIPDKSDIPAPAVLKDLAIEPEQYKYYNRKPVFVTFVNKEKPDQWGILNHSKKSIMLADGVIRTFDYSIVLYPLEVYNMPSYYRKQSHPVSISRFLELKQMWVEMNTADDTIRAEYNGWYVHNHSKTMIVNMMNGNVLPVRGYGKSYRAYVDPFDVVDHS